MGDTLQFVLSERHFLSSTLFYFEFILSFNFPFKNLHSGYSSFVTMAKVLYCIALLLFDWSSADTKRLDESELMRRCKQRDIAYIKEKVAEFGNTTVIEAEEYSKHCFITMLYWGNTFHSTCKMDYSNPELFFKGGREKRLQKEREIPP